MQRKSKSSGSASSETTEELKARLAALDLEILDEEFRRRAEGDLLFFCRHVLGYADLDDHLHGAIVNTLTDTKVKKKLLLLPRGHLKSSIATVGFAIWLAVNDSNRTIAIFNETAELAISFLGEIRHHFENNPVLRKYWGHVIPDKDSRRAGDWTRSSLTLNRNRIRRDPTFSAKGIDEATAGRHPDIIICDDLISDRTVRTPESIARSIQRFQELQALLEPPNDRDPFVGTEVVIGTRWHWQDLYNFIIENLSEFWHIVVRSAIEQGRIVFPQKFTREKLRELRETMGEWVFSAQMLNQPVDTESAIFPVSLVNERTWKGDQVRFLDRVPCLTYLAVDPAWEGEDSTGLAAGARAQNGKLYVLEAKRLRVSPDQMLETVVALALKWRVQKIAFEGVIGGQEWLIKNLRELLAQRNRVIPVVAMSHGNRSKNARIVGLVPELQYRRLYLHERDCEPLRTEMLQYPRSTFDDCLDACEMLYRVSTKPGQGKDVPAHRVPGTGEYELRQLEREGKRRMRDAGKGRHRRIR